MVSDGWSTGVFFRELTGTVFRVGAGQTIAAAGFADSVCGLCRLAKGWLGDCRLANQLEYWRSQLAGVPTLSHHTPATGRSFVSGARLPLTLSGESVSD